LQVVQRAIYAVMDKLAWAFGHIRTQLVPLPEPAPMRANTLLARFRTAAAPGWRRLVRGMIVATGLGILIGMQLALSYGINQTQWVWLITSFVAVVFVVLVFSWPSHMFVVWLTLSPIASLLFRIKSESELPAITFDRVMLSGLALALLLRQLKDRYTGVSLKFGEYLLLIFPIYLLATIPFIHHGATFNILGQIAVRGGDLAMVYFVTRTALSSSKHVRWVIAAVIVIATYSSFLGVLDQISGQWSVLKIIGISANLVWTGGSEAGRSSGPYASPFDLAIVVGVGVMFALHVINWSSCRWMRLCCFFVLPLLVAAWWCTYSRSTYLGLILGLCVMPLVSRKRRQYVMLLTVIAVVAAVAIPILMRDKKISDRFRNPENVVARIATDTAMWNMFKQHPLFGVGLGNVKGNMGAYAESVMGIPGLKVWLNIGSWPNRTARALPLSPHNTQITLLAEYGTVGGLLFFGMIVALLVHMWKAYLATGHSGLVGRDFTSIALINFFALVTFAWSAGFYDTTRFSMIFTWVLIALAIRLPHIAKQDQTAPEDSQSANRIM